MRIFVAEKILFQHQIFGHERFLLQLTVGSIPHAKIMRAIELYGTEVAPIVRREIGSAGTRDAGGTPIGNATAARTQSR